MTANNDFLAFLTIPTITNLGQTGIQLDGCDFEFHQSFPGEPSFLVYDTNKNQLNEIPTTFTPTSTNNVYTFNSFTINSYEFTGTYYRCQLTPNKDAFDDDVESEFSVHNNITGKRRLIIL